MSDHTQIERTPLGVFKTFLFGLLGFLLFGAAIAWLLSTYRNVKTVDEERAQVRLHYKMKLEAEVAKLLTTYGWVDQETGQVHIPLAQAIPLAARALAAKPVKATKIPVPGTPAAEAADAAALASPAAAPAAVTAPVAAPAAPAPQPTPEVRP